MHVRLVKTHKCQNSIVFLYWAWLTGLERKTLNSPKIYAKHKIGSTNIRFAKFWLTFVFLCFVVWKSAFCYEKSAWCHVKMLEVVKVLKILFFVIPNLINRFGKENSQLTKNIRVTPNNTKLVLPKIVLHIFEKLLLFVLFGMKKCFMLWKKCLMLCKFAWSRESFKNPVFCDTEPD